MLFEDFKVDPAAFAERLCAMLEIEKVAITAPDKKINKSLSLRQIKLIRRLNRYKKVLKRGEYGGRIFGYKLRFIEHRLQGKEKFQFSEKLQAELRNTFIADNQKLTNILPHLKDSPRFTNEYLGE